MEISIKLDQVRVPFQTLVQIWAASLENPRQCCMRRALRALYQIALQQYNTKGASYRDQAGP